MARFTPTLRARFVHPSETSKEELEHMAADPQRAFQQTDLVVTSYGMALRQEWLAALPWRLVVLDEAQAIKNPAARQTRLVKRLQAEARIALTGTPVENRLSDLWSIFDFLCPGLLGTQAKFKEFVKRLAERAENRYAPLRSLVQPYLLRRLKTDRRVIDDLPEKVEVRAFAGLSKRQAVMYAKLVGELAEDLKAAEGMKRRGLVLAYLMRLKQLCNHPSQLLGDGRFLPADSGKFARLAEIGEEIASRQERALVFTQFREMTQPLADYLATVFGRPGLVLHGGTPVGRRRGLVEQLPAGRRTAVLRRLAEGRRHGAEPYGRLARRAFRPLVEPGRREPGHRPGLPHRAAAKRAGPQIRVPRHHRRTNRRPDRGKTPIGRRPDRRRRREAANRDVRHRADPLRVARRDYGL